MPHVVIKIAAGRSAEQKREIADEVAAALVRVAGCQSAEVSVDVVDVPGDRWFADVYGPEILPRMGELQKRPGYGPP